MGSERRSMSRSVLASCVALGLVGHRERPCLCQRNVPLDPSSSGRLDSTAGWGCSRLVYVYWNVSLSKKNQLWFAAAMRNHAGRGASRAERRRREAATIQSSGSNKVAALALSVLCRGPACKRPWAVPVGGVSGSSSI